MEYVFHSSLKGPWTGLLLPFLKGGRKSGIKESDEDFEFVQQKEDKKANADIDFEEDHKCGICWELLARPVTLDCGFSFCESCIALILSRAWEAREQGAKCPMLGRDCQSGLVRKLPQLNIILHNELKRLHRYH